MFAAIADVSRLVRSQRSVRDRRYDPPGGAVAKLDKAPVSKTGDSRFESWLPRFLLPVIGALQRGE
jgi:hypothetical protein